MFAGDNSENRKHVFEEEAKPLGLNPSDWGSWGPETPATTVQHTEAGLDPGPEQGPGAQDADSCYRIR